MVGLVVIKFNKSALAIPFIFHVRDRNIRPQRVSLPLYYPIGYILIKQHLPYLLEQIFDILSSLRTDLQKRYIIFIRQSLSLSQLHHSVCFEVQFIPGEDLDDVFGRVFVDLLHPSFWVGWGVPIFSKERASSME